MNTERLYEILEDLLLTYSPSRKEIDVAKYVIEFFERVGARVYLDENQDTYGGNAPVIFAKLEGDLEGQVSFSAHMDVIEPNEGLKIIKEDRIWKTDGTTTLGGDDKSGLATILYLFEHFKDKAHKTMYAIITPGEEVGMLGAKSIGWDKLYENMNPSKNICILDSGGPKGTIGYAAPTSYNFSASITGRTAHAGMEPEKGINAIHLAAKALAKMEIGRIDEKTTSNVSVIKSDFASNVVPDYVEFSGEVRSHKDSRALEILEGYEKAIKEVAGSNYTFEKSSDYPALKSTDDLAFAKEIGEAYKETGVEPSFVTMGGGTDGNIYAGQGFNSIVLTTGMAKVHTKEEYLDLDAFENTAQVLISYLGK